MVAIGRALMAGPRLAPTLVDPVFGVIETLHRKGCREVKA